MTEHQKELKMLKLAILALIIALLAGAAGLPGLSSFALGVSKFMFSIVGLVVLAVLILGFLLLRKVRKTAQGL